MGIGEYEPYCLEDTDQHRFSQMSFTHICENLCKRLVFNECRARSARTQFEDAEYQ